MNKILLSLGLLASVGTAFAAEPTSCAPTPEIPANQVISIYSEAYPSQVPGWFFGEWGSGTVETAETIVAGNESRRYATTSLGYFGWQFESTPLNVADLEYMHADVYSEGPASMRFVPITGAPEVGATRSLTVDAWTSVDIPLSEFNGANLANIIQIKYDNIGAGVIHIDNVFFYTTQASTDTEAPANGTATLLESGYTDITLQCTATDESAITFEAYSAEGNTPFATVKRGGVSGEPTAVSITGLTPNTEYVINIKATDFNGNVAEIAPVTASTLALPEPAPTPAHKADVNMVVSLYSDAYPSVDFAPQWWGQAGTATELELAEGDKAFYLANLNYQGWQFATTSAPEATHIHFDIYMHKGVRVLVTPIWLTADGATNDSSTYDCSDLEADTWLSYDVELATLPNGTSINPDFFQFKVDAQPDSSVSGKQMFIDNIYLYKYVSSGIEAVEAAGAKAEYYNLSGMRIDNPTSGLYIRLTGDKAEKVYIK